LSGIATARSGKGEPVIQETEVDGVQTLLAPTSGRLHAGLTFRVGRADETLATAGITHLLEHLALVRHGLTDYHFNGATDAVVTHFHMQGSEDDVVRFLSGVCDSLADLPVDRLDTEKAILRTEAASRNTGAADSMPLWRYGARTYGLVSYAELGLPRLRADDVRQWASTWFTRENAVLWIAADRVPSGLRLRLPGGVRRPVPQPSSALPVMPAYFCSAANGVAFDAVVRRRMAGAVYAGVLARELFRSLRQEGGYSYTTDASYGVRGDGLATVTALADTLPDKLDAVLGGFVDVLAKLQVGRVEQADIDSLRTQHEQSLLQPDREAARLPSAAFNVLTGQPNLTVEDTRDELARVTVEDVHEVALEAAGSGLLLVPERHSADWAGYTPAPTYSASAVQGARYRSKEHDDVDLVIGAEGVSVVTATGPATVRFDQCAIAMCWPDGARQLIGDDGIAVRVEPTLYELPPGATVAVDAGVPHTAVVWMPAREPDKIPQPKPKPVEPVPASVPTRKSSPARTAAFVTLVVLASIMGAMAALCSLAVASADPANPDEAALRDPVAITMLVCTWLSAAVFVASALLVWHRRRGQSPAVNA
jgi:predicted Zn-dependent peptidase